MLQSGNELPNGRKEEEKGEEEKDITRLKNCTP
jgi:hypothetical protein